MSPLDTKILCERLRDCGFKRPRLVVPTEMAAVGFQLVKLAWHGPVGAKEFVPNPVLDWKPEFLVSESATDWYLEEAES